MIAVSSKRILIAAGGTGGHIFPAISMANKIKEIDSSADVIFCIDKRIDKKLPDKFNYKYYLLDAPRMPYGLSLKWFLFLIKLIFSFSKSARILDEVNPEVVVGFGAYISGPLLAQAKRQNKKIIIDEQNVTMGRANYLLSKISDKIVVGFDNPQYQKDARYILIGNPIREGLLEDLNALNKERALGLLGLDITKKTVLVMGGSLGSHIINTIFLQMLNNLSNTILDSLQIIHLTGKGEFDNVNSVYKNINVRFKAYPFFERMGLLYKVSDFAICRAGAITISELCVFALPAILIPYKKAGAHQMQNAMYLKEKDAAIMIEEKNLTPIALKNAFLSLLNSDEKLSAMSKNTKLLAKIDAAKKLAEAVLAV